MSEFIAFPHLKISDASFLDTISARSACVKCNRSRMYFCYNCHIPVPSLQGKIPCVELPFKVVIVKYPGELPGKSTSVHACILAPDHTTIHEYPSIPQFDDGENVVVVFPSAEATSIKEYVLSKHRQLKQQKVEKSKEQLDVPQQHKQQYKHHETNSCNNLQSSSKPPFNHSTIQHHHHHDSTNQHHHHHDSTNQHHHHHHHFIDTIILIDCTWHQTSKIFLDPRVKSLPLVQLSEHHTKYWRPLHKKPPTCLSTIETLYYTAVEYAVVVMELEEGGGERDSEKEEVVEETPDRDGEGVREGEREEVVGDGGEGKRVREGEIIVERDGEGRMDGDDDEGIELGSLLGEPKKNNKNSVGMENRNGNDQIAISTTRSSDISNKYANLLFFFSYFYTKIRSSAMENGRVLRSYEGGLRVKGQGKKRKEITYI